MTRAEALASRAPAAREAGEEALSQMRRPFLAGRRLYLRLLEESDTSEDYLGWLNDGKVTRYLGGPTGRLPATPDTLTIPSDHDPFRMGSGTLWDGRTLYELYRGAFMPWEWQPKLQSVARGLGIDFFRRRTMLRRWNSWRGLAYPSTRCLV